MELCHKFVNCFRLSIHSGWGDEHPGDRGDKEGHGEEVGEWDNNGGEEERGEQYQCEEED